MITTLLPILSPVVQQVFTSLFPDKEKAREAEHKLMQALLAADLSQLQVNQVEAGHRSLFVAGWRPWIGWVCGISLFWTFIVQPIAIWLNAVFAWQATMPQIESTYLFELVMAMLGLGGLRSFEKMKGVAR